MTEKITYVCDACGKEFDPSNFSRSDCLSHEKLCSEYKKEIEQLLEAYKPRIKIYAVTWYNYSTHDECLKSLMIKLFLHYKAAVNFKNEWSFGEHNPEIRTLEFDYAEE